VVGGVKDSLVPCPAEMIRTNFYFDIVPELDAKMMDIIDIENL